MMHLLSAPYRQLNFFQLENYNVSRFLHVFPKSFVGGPLRTPTEWTKKLVLIVCVSAVLSLVVIAAVSLVSYIFGIVSAIVLYEFFGFVAVISSYIVWPAEYALRQRIVHQAQKKLRSLNTITVIAVAGSYGKTTMKEALRSVLSRTLRVVATKGSINTPIGISRVIMKSLNEKTDVFIVEMGEHYTGDIAELARLVVPQITVITGINEAHLERFETMDALTNGIFEAVDGTVADGTIVLNADSERVCASFSSHVGSRKVVWYSSHNDSRATLTAHNIHFHIDGNGYTFDVSRGEESLGSFSTQLLGEYAIGVALASLEVASLMKVPTHDAREGLRTFASVSHRLEPIKTPRALIIDDSYNGNPEGVKYAIQLLAKFEGRRKVYVTPGLVEAGTETERIHTSIGEQLATVADVVVLIQNSVTGYIRKGLENKGFTGTIYEYQSAVDAHKAMAELTKSGDVVLFQNDWPDNYL